MVVQVHRPYTMIGACRIAQALFIERTLSTFLDASPLD
jgi:hypothetical protein